MKRSKYFNTRLVMYGRQDTIVFPERQGGASEAVDSGTVYIPVIVETVSYPSVAVSKTFGVLRNVIGFVAEVSFSKKTPLPIMSTARWHFYMSHPSNAEFDALHTDPFEDKDANVDVDMSRARAENKISMFIPLAINHGAQSYSSGTAFVIPNMVTLTGGMITLRYEVPAGVSYEEYNVKIEPVYHNSKLFTEKLKMHSHSVEEFASELLEDGILEDN